MVFRAVFSSAMVQMLMIGVEMAAGIHVDFLPRVLLTVPLAIAFEALVECAWGRK